MKKFFTSILIALSLLICNELSAQETVKHIVQKGETISSIATNYGVTVAECTLTDMLDTVSADFCKALTVCER